MKKQFLVGLVSFLFFFGFMSESFIAFAVDLTDTQPPKITSIRQIELPGVSEWVRFEITVEDEKNKVYLNENANSMNANSKLAIAKDVEPSGLTPFDFTKLSVPGICLPRIYYSGAPLLGIKEIKSLASIDGRKKVFVVTLRQSLPLIQEPTYSKPMSTECYPLINKSKLVLFYELSGHFYDEAGNFNEVNLPNSSFGSRKYWIEFPVILKDQSYFCLPNVEKKQIESKDSFWPKIDYIEKLLNSIQNWSSLEIKRISEYVIPLKKMNDIRKSVFESDLPPSIEQLSNWNLLCSQYKNPDSDWIRVKDNVYNDATKLAGFIQSQSAPIAKPKSIVKSIICIKRNTVKKITGENPKCPAGYKKK